MKAEFLNNPEKIAELTATLRQLWKIPSEIEIKPEWIYDKFALMDGTFGKIDEWKICLSGKCTNTHCIFGSEGENYEELTIENGELVFKKSFCPAKATRIINESGIPNRYKKCRATDYSVLPGNYEALKATHDFTTGKKKGIFLFGEPGIGKTFLASITANELAHKNKRTIFITEGNLMHELRGFENPELPEKRIKFFKAARLILDDLGSQPLNPYSYGILFNLFNERYNDNAPTIITSNFSPKALQERLGGYEGMRISRRITAICDPVAITEKPDKGYNS